MVNGRRRATQRTSLVRLSVVALVLAVLTGVTVAAGRQVIADRNFSPITVPSAPPTAPAIAAVLHDLTAPPPASASASAALAPSAAGVQAALRAGLTNPALGPLPAAQVIDLLTGATLISQRGTALMAPASLAKLLLAVAALTAYRATDRFSTRIVAGAAPGTVVLVGGGDPTLTAAAVGSAPAYPQSARMSDLAAQLKASGTAVTQIEVDDSLFSGPATAPGWGTEDAPSEYASRITAAMVDGGRDSPLAAVRSAAPDLAAGNALAAALGAGAAVSLGPAPVGARVLATVRSASLGTLVEQMLQSSDDVIAETLARQVAIAARAPATFAGAAAAISSTVARLGINAGATMKDGSGLSVADRLSASALTQILQVSLSSQHPELHAMLAGLPVAGWEGTLSDRFAGATAAGRGVVRAKTGTLPDQGVSTEAGVVTDLDGRQLIFVFLGNGAPDVDASRAALDGLASTLAGCGCR